MSSETQLGSARAGCARPGIGVVLSALVTLVMGSLAYGDNAPPPASSKPQHFNLGHGPLQDTITLTPAVWIPERTSSEPQSGAQAVSVFVTAPLDYEFNLTIDRITGEKGRALFYGYLSSVSMVGLGPDVPIEFPIVGLEVSDIVDNIYLPATLLLPSGEIRQVVDLSTVLGASWTEIKVTATIPLAGQGGEPRPFDFTYKAPAGGPKATVRFFGTTELSGDMCEIVIPEGRTTPGPFEVEPSESKKMKLSVLNKCWSRKVDDGGIRAKGTIKGAPRDMGLDKFTAIGIQSIRFAPQNARPPFFQPNRPRSMRFTARGPAEFGFTVALNAGGPAVTKGATLSLNPNPVPVTTNGTETFFATFSAEVRAGPGVKIGNFVGESFFIRAVLENQEACKLDSKVLGR